MNWVHVPDGATTHAGANNGPCGPSVSAGALPVVPATATYAQVMSTMSMVEVRQRLQALNESDAVSNMTGNDVRWVAAGIIGRPMQPLELIRWEEGAESETGTPPTDEDLRNLCRNHRSLVFASSDSFPPSPEVPPAPSAGSTGCRTTNPGRPC